MEGTGLGSYCSWVCSACWCAWRVSCIVGCCNTIAAEHGRYGQSCIQKLWSAQAVLSLYGVLEYMLCSDIVLLLNVADILYAGRVVSEQ